MIIGLCLATQHIGREFWSGLYRRFLCLRGIEEQPLRKNINSSDGLVYYQSDRKMKGSVLALILLFTVAAGENVSVSLLYQEFRKGVYTIDGPENIAAHVPTSDFIHGFIDITGKLYIDIMLEYYRQARLTGIIVGNNFVGAVEVLLRRTKEAPEDTSSYLESTISDVNDRLNKFLIAKPGVSNAEDKELPKLPAHGPILTHYENYEPEILFNDLENRVDQDMASVHNFVQKIYLLGWKQARLSLKKLQQQFRDQFLHCTVLKTFLEETKKINAESELVRKHVTSESWNKYKELSDRVASIAANLTLTPQFCQTDVPQK